MVFYGARSFTTRRMSMGCDHQQCSKQHHFAIGADCPTPSAVSICRVDKHSASTNVGWVDVLCLSTLQLSSLFLAAE
jgi:hypothetical protein